MRNELSLHRAYDTRYLLICNDEFSKKIGGKIDVHTCTLNFSIRLTMVKFRIICGFWSRRFRIILSIHSIKLTNIQGKIQPNVIDYANGDEGVATFKR